MNAHDLPSLLDFGQLMRQPLVFEGVLALSDLVRLAQATGLEQDDEVWVRLESGIDRATERLILQGELKTRLALVCQRCLQPFDLSINIDLSLAPHAENEWDVRLPEGYEPVLVDERGQMGTAHLVEDELLLGLPLIAKHAEADCPVVLAEVSQDALLAQQCSKPNPFASLESLKEGE